ncbi:MAG: hypothetical protein OIN86_06780 [Candidatus Methanoperedens sp.]|nr:hypothetical protein [Candidatus Methanoperedens sp.]CAG1009326.1 hypothetical protein METP1_03713 [Methanosarcinales archaeon]
MNRINSTIKLQSIIFFKILFLILLLLFNSAVGAGAETTVAGTHAMENGQVCTDCHKFDEVNKNSNPDSLPVANKPENSNLKTSGNEFIQSDIQGGGQDCVFCHDITGNGAPPDKRIDTLAVKQGVHKNLGNSTINTTALSDMIDKACWACHGNGTEPALHPDNYKTPYGCADCHNSTYNLTKTNLSVIPDLITKKIYEHIPPPHYQEIDSTLNSSNATCTGCHNKSMVSYTDPGFSTVSNVSHYASITNLTGPTINCGLCHKSPANAYWANVVRHPARSQNDSFCANCHNTTLAVDLHSQQLVKPMSIHFGFDWNNKDYLNGLDPNEACIACHSLFGNVYSRCEDCHLENGRGPVNISGEIRSDYNNTVPRVYAHTNFSASVNVPNQSGFYPGSTRPSSCFSGDSSGSTCHGNPYGTRDQNGGYFASFTASYLTGSPYHFTGTIDWLPDTTNCLFCHKQPDTSIRNAWGNATQITGGTHNWYMGDDNSRCWKCHVTTGVVPDDFHSDTLRGAGGDDCVGCHVPNDVNDSKFGRHANINTTDGSGVVSNFDCWTCHYQKDMDRSHVYLCDSCHINSSGIVNISNTSLIMSDFMHGSMNTCRACHAPSGGSHPGYHQKGTVGPLGVVENILRKVLNS